MTTTDTIPPALLARWKAHDAKDAALLELAALNAALKTSQEVSRLVRTLVYGEVGNKEALKGATVDEIGLALGGLSQSSASRIRVENRGMTEWEAVRDRLVSEIAAGLEVVRGIVEVEG